MIVVLPAFRYLLTFIYHCKSAWWKKVCCTNRNIINNIFKVLLIKMGHDFMEQIFEVMTSTLLQY